MSNLYFNQLRKCFPSTIDDKLIEDLIRNNERIAIKKNDLLVEYQTVENAVFFVVNGSFIKNVLTSENETRTVLFHTDCFANFMMCSDSYLSGEKTDYSIVANEDSNVLKINNAYFLACLETSLPFLRYYAFYHERSFAYLEQSRDKMLSLSSEEYMQWLYDRYPFIFQMFPSKSIANFMGITPVSFSNLLQKMLP